MQIIAYLGGKLGSKPTSTGNIKRRNKLILRLIGGQKSYCNL